MILKYYDDSVLVDLAVKCDVDSCQREATQSFGKDSHLCSQHYEAWGYFHTGYQSALGKAYSGRLNRKVWDKAMKDFLEWCRVEIVACTQIAEAVLRVRSVGK